MALEVNPQQLESLTVHEAQLYAALSRAVETKSPMDTRWAFNMSRIGAGDDYRTISTQHHSTLKRTGNTSLDSVLMLMRVDCALIEGLDQVVNKREPSVLYGPKQEITSDTQLILAIKHAETYGAMENAVLSAVQTLGFDATYEAIDRARVPRGTSMM